MGLGDLSAKYESNGDPAAVSDGVGDGGGVSFGIYQFSSAAGVVQKFVDWLRQHDGPFNQYGEVLAAAGDPDSEAFQDKWRELGTTDPGGFTDLQQEYVKPIYFDTGVDNLMRRYGFDIPSRSDALKEVLWSNCVQHGSYYGAQVFKDAADLAGQDLNSISDHDLIYNIYEVKLTDMSWSSGSPDERPGLFARWNNERDDALAMLG